MRRARRTGPPVPREDAEQMALARWLDACGILWCHVPNGGYRGKRAAAALKRHGVKAGVPDVLIFDAPPRSNLRGAAIELKRTKGGRLSTEQASWVSALSERGWLASVCKGCDEAIRLLQANGYGVAIR